MASGSASATSRAKRSASEQGQHGLMERGTGPGALLAAAEDAEKEDDGFKSEEEAVFYWNPSRNVEMAAKRKYPDGVVGLTAKAAAAIQDTVREPDGMLFVAPEGQDMNRWCIGKLPNDMPGYGFLPQATKKQSKGHITSDFDEVRNAIDITVDNNYYGDFKACIVDHMKISKPLHDKLRLHGRDAAEGRKQRGFNSTKRPALDPARTHLAFKPNSPTPQALDAARFDAFYDRMKPICDKVLDEHYKECEKNGTTPPEIVAKWKDVVRMLASSTCINTTRDANAAEKKADAAANDVSDEEDDGDDEAGPSRKKATKPKIAINRKTGAPRRTRRKLEATQPPPNRHFPHDQFDMILGHLAVPKGVKRPLALEDVQAEEVQDTYAEPNKRRKL